ncbi:MAG: efflux RND transporter permease subunit, partial [Acidobacteria bacterium]|nr:efflux RND transporter permease subunit [Acidobacteriota bacterium]
MDRLIEWFTRNGVGANLLMALILAAGGLTMFRIKQEVFPEFSLDLITIQMKYLGAAPEEVEEAVCVRIEEAIQGLDGIKRIRSTSAEGFGNVVVELMLGADSARLLDDIKSRVDAIDTFPSETEKPIIRELTNRRQVIDVAISGNADEATFKELAERIRDELSARPGITAVEIANTRDYEIAIEVSESALRKYGLTFDQVARAVRNSSLDLPGGSLKTPGGEILIRTKGQAYRGKDFEAIEVMTRPDGSRVTIGDIAKVVDGFAETDRLARFDGQTSALVEVFRIGEQSALDIAGSVKSYLEEAKSWLPAGIKLSIWQDQSKVLKDRLSLLIRNGLQGLVLVFLILALFLRFRLAFWVTAGIPISFMGTFWLMPYLDVSVNLISLFAFIVVLGIVVDDAIVVGENIYSHQNRHGNGLRGAIEGAKEVAVPVTFGVLTTVAAFMPLLNVPGTIGKVMRVIPLVVITCLVFSFIESKLILPNHLSHLKPRKPGEKGSAWSRFQDRFATGLDRFIRRIYSPFLEKALSLRYLSLAAGVSIMILTAGMVASGMIRFEFFPSVEADYISASLTMPQGTPVEVTAQAVAELEASARKVQEEYSQNAEGDDLFHHVSAAVGSQPFRKAQSQNAGGVASGDSGSHLGEVTIELKPAEFREKISSEALVNRWRELTGVIPDAVQVSFSASLFSPGDDVDVQFTGTNIEHLRAAANLLKDKLVAINGVSDVADSFREGKREIKVNLLPQGELLGLSQLDLARQVRQGFYGEEAQRVQRGRDDIRVMVRYPREERASLGYLERMYIRTGQGDAIPLAQVAEVEEGRGYAAISRVNRRRAINVTADVNAAVIAPDDVLKMVQDEFLPEIRNQFPDLFVSFEGQKAEQRDTMGGLKSGFIVAMILIYALLAVPLRSYVYPLLIMLAIP